MKVISKIHIIIVLFAIIFASRLRGQEEEIINLAEYFYSMKSQVVYPELIPYQIVPIDPEPDCRLEVGVQLVHPYAIEKMVEAHKQETLDIIYKRIAFELVNPEKQAGLFMIDDQLYHLVRIPYTGAAEDYGMGWTWE